MQKLYCRFYCHCFLKSFFYRYLVTDIMSVDIYLRKFIVDSKVAILPIKIRKFTVVKSPFTSKLSREQFEIKTFKGVYISEFSNKFLFNIHKNLIITFFKHSYMDIRLEYNINVFK